MSISPCFSFTAYRDRCFHRSFTAAGLRPSTTALRDGTTIRCWVPRSADPTLPSLLLLHGFGANATWQWAPYLKPLIASGFNVYVPDLVFFGGSFTVRPDRSESFQAESVMAAMQAVGVSRFAGIVGVSYGGFVGYRIAAMFPEAVDRLVLCCAGVCIEEKDLAQGIFVVSDISEAAGLLLPQTPDKLRQLIRLTHCNPPRGIPSCFLSDYIHVMCTDYVQEKSELINALIKERKLSDLPKITQPTLIIWGEQDLVFPLELGHRLKRHLEENSQLVVIRDAGHAVNLEKHKELCKHIKAFVVNSSAKRHIRNKGPRWWIATRGAAPGMKRLPSNLPLLSGTKGSVRMT